MRTVVFILFSLLPCFLFAQKVISPDTIPLSASTENIQVHLLTSDSLACSYLIYIKKEVPLHKHVSHAEHVYVLEGEGRMRLGEDNIQIKKGDLIYIPRDTPHSLYTTSDLPVKVISLQAPYFDGKDRVIIK